MTDPETLVIISALVGAGCMAGWGLAAAREPKPVADVPVLHPGNANLVAILRAVAGDVEAGGQRCADGLRDIARVIQISATEPVEERLRVRVGGIVEDFASVPMRGAQRIKEGT